MKRVLLGVLLLAAVGCATLEEIEDKIKEFEEYLDEWDQLTLEDIWDKLKGHEATKDEEGWSTGSAKIEPEGRPKNWSWKFVTKGIDASRNKDKEKAEQGLFCVFLTTGKIYPYIMHGGRNAIRIRGKGGEVFNVSCGDWIHKPIPTDRAEWCVSVTNGTFDLTLNGQPLGRKALTSKDDVLPFDIGDGRLKGIVVSQWEGDRPLKSPWKAEEIQ